MCGMMNELATAIGHQIRVTRTDRRMNQEDLARAAGITRSTVSRVETGKVLPDLSTLVEIADALEVSLDEITGRT